LLYIPTNALCFINVILLFSNYRHVSASHVAIFSVVIAIIQIYFFLHCIYVFVFLRFSPEDYHMRGLNMSVVVT